MNTHQEDKKSNNPANNVVRKGMKFLYTNADQFANKRDDLVAMIADDEPDVIMITEVIPKCQSNPIALALLVKSTFNFDPYTENLPSTRRYP